MNWPILTVMPANLLIASVLSLASLGPDPELAHDLGRQAKAVQAYLAAVPDSLLGYRPTPGVRTFAEQVEHIALAADLLSAAAVDQPADGDMAPGSCRCLDSRAKLAAFVSGAFARALERLDKVPNGDSQLKTFFGVGRTRLGWFRWIQEHAAWTLGQVVPYLRLNGLTPPTYLPL